MRATSLLLAIALLQACACSGGTKKGPTPPAGGDAGAVASAAGGDAAPPVAEPLTGTECDALVDHVVELAARERAGKVDADAASTPEEVAATQAKLRAELRASCLAETTRQVWQCAMRAENREALRACYAAR